MEQSDLPQSGAQEFDGGMLFDPEANLGAELDAAVMEAIQSGSIYFEDI